MAAPDLLAVVKATAVAVVIAAVVFVAPVAPTVDGFAPSLANDARLTHVALLFRHTVRAPRVFPHSDALLTPALFPRGVQRSTRRGLEAAYNVSRTVWSQWYPDGQLYTGSPAEVYARSSQADRCYETMTMVLNGLCPSPDDIPVSPVAIRMPPTGTDKYVENCGNMKFILRDYNPDTAVSEAIADEEGFKTVGQYVQFLKNMSGEHNESVNYFYMAYMEGFLSVDFEGRFTEKDHWILKYPKTREFVRLYLLDISLNVVAPYYGHFLMNGIADQLTRAADSSTTTAPAGAATHHRLSLFSYHDLNLQAVLRALGLRGTPTEPMAAVAFELWREPEPAPGRWRVLVRLSSGLDSSWQYGAARYVQVRRPSGESVDSLAAVSGLLREFYRDSINTTSCGYFGGDAKV